MSSLDRGVNREYVGLFPTVNGFDRTESFVKSSKESPEWRVEVTKKNFRGQGYQRDSNLYTYTHTCMIIYLQIHIHIPT